MTIASKLQLALNSKQAIKVALQNKDANPTDDFSTYAGLIEELAGAGIAKPSIVSPLDGATGVRRFPIITSSAYGGITENGPDPHQDSLWEFASDAEFTNIIHSSGWTSEHLESYEVSVADKLDGEITVYVRVTYRGESGETGVSDPISFETSAIEVGVVLDGDIVYAKLGEDWLLAAPATKRERRRWGLRGTDVTELPNDPSPDPNTGTYNTDVLTSAAYSSVVDDYSIVGAPAATFCRDMGYDLPNREELNLMYQNQGMIDSADTSGGSNTLASFGSVNVYSSTEYSNRNVLYQRFSDGVQSNVGKNVDSWVAPVRRIPV